MTGEPTSSGAISALIWKFGALKLLGLGSALFGAGIMAIFRPPQNRKELLYQAAVALGASLLLGSMAVKALDSWWDWISISTDPLEDVIQFIAMVHGMIGALAWGIFGGIAVIRDKLGNDPIKTVKELRD